MHESPRVAAWLDAATVSADDTEAPLFQHVDRGGTLRGPLSARLVRRIIKHRCAAAGVEGKATFLLAILVMASMMLCAVVSARRFRLW